MSYDLSALFYLIASVLFILALRGLSHPETARQGNYFGIAGMVIAIVTTILLPEVQSYFVILGGLVVGGAVGSMIALRIQMTALPQLVAAFHSLVGLAAVFVAAAAFYSPEAYGIGTTGDIHAASLIEMSLGVAIGAITFTGSIIAFGKLQGLISGKPVVFPMQHMVNLGLGILLVLLIVLLVSGQSGTTFWLIVLVSLALGVLIIIPIGGADMPVVISMLNSYIMCKGMNRSFFSVILGGFGGESAGPAEDMGDKTVKSGSADDASFIMKNAGSVIIVPGYGMAVAQAQHALREMAELLKEEGVTVKYAIHPVAGRMPGHMNVLLAEAGVPYDEVFEMEEINRDFSSADVAFVIGANDITNPAAKTDASSPIYGMPILEVANAKTVLFIKRSLGSGYAGVDNPMFYADNTMMLFDDAKKMCEQIVKALEQ